MTGVDQTTEQLIVGLLQELRDGGTTILHATHDLESAAEISDQLCFVNRRVVAYGPPAETFTPSILHATFGGELADRAGRGPQPRARGRPPRAGRQ